MADQETIAVYDSQVEAYKKLTGEQAKDPTLFGFLAQVKSGGHILDLGCGPGTAAAVMRQQGFSVDASDASIEMVKLANEQHNIGARQATFDDINETEFYDAVWANFSLLHAAPEEFPGYLRALNTAIKRGGLFHIGMKLGTNSARDKIGRMYSYYSEESLCQHLANAGFEDMNIETGEGLGLAGDVEPWIVVTSKKVV